MADSTGTTDLTDFDAAEIDATDPVRQKHGIGARLKALKATADAADVSLAALVVADLSQVMKDVAVAAVDSDVADLANPGATLGGVTMATAVNKRVLLTNQTAPAENGLYLWSAADEPLVRTDDADSTAEVVNGWVVAVTGGTYAGSVWVAGPCATLDTSSITVTQAAGSVATLIATLASTANGEGASTVAIEDAATLYTATDVEAALGEVKVIVDAAVAENTDGQVFIGAESMVVVDGTWALATGAGGVTQTRTAAAAAHSVLFPLPLAARTTALKGRKITSYDLVYAVSVEAADEVAATLVVTTLGGDTVAPTAAGAAVTYDVDHDAAGERGGIKEHTATATLDTPAYIGADEGAGILVEVDDQTGGNAVIVLKGILVRFSETLIDAA